MQEEMQEKAREEKMLVIEREAMVHRHVEFKRGKKYEYGFVRVYLPASFIGRRVRVIVFDADSVASDER